MENATNETVAMKRTERQQQSRELQQGRNIAVKKAKIMTAPQIFEVGAFEEVPSLSGLLLQLCRFCCDLLQQRIHVSHVKPWLDTPKPSSKNERAG